MSLLKQITKEIISVVQPIREVAKIRVRIGREQESKKTYYIKTPL